MNNNRKSNQNRTRRTVAAVLIVAALIVIVGVILVSRCLSFDETGAHVIDRYGVLTEPTDTLEQTPEDKNETPKDDKKAEKDKKTDKKKQYTRAIMLSADKVSEVKDQLIACAKDDMIDTVVVNIKDAEGNLNIPIDTNALDNAEYLVSSGGETLKSTIGALKENGIHVIGRIYCFHDALATKQNSDLAIQYELGGTWLDYDNSRWLDPTNPEAVAYLEDIARSAVQAGCDEIMLADVTFPPRGHLDRAMFDRTPQDQAGVLADAVKDMKKAVGEVPVSLTADALAGLIELSSNGVEDGIPLGDVGTLIKTAHRLFIPIDSSSVDSVKDTLDSLAKKAVIVPIFLSGETWKTYDGDAVLNGMFDGDTALDAMKSN